MIFVPHSSLEPLTAGVADSDVGKDEIVTVGDEAVGKEPPKWVAFGRAEDIVA